MVPVANAKLFYQFGVGGAGIFPLSVKYAAVQIVDLIILSIAFSYAD